MPEKLTKSLIDLAAPDPARDTFIWDTETSGLGVRVTRAGAKSFVFQYYQPIEKRYRRMTIGRYGGELTLPQARRLAAKTRLEVAAGEDPAGRLKQAQEAPTLADLASRFMTEHATKKKSSTSRNYKLLWDVHLLPALGSRKVADIRWEHIAALHHAMRSTPFAANRMLSLVSRAFGLAARWGWWPREMPNPGRGHDRFPERRRGQALEAVNLRSIGRALAMESPGSVSAAAFTFCLLTGARPGEVLRMRWADLDCRIWRLPDAKTGPRSVYVGEAALTVIQGLTRVSEYVFPGRSLTSPMADLKRLWERLVQRSEIPAGLRLYDATRHTFASTALELEIPLERVKVLIGHSPSGDVTSRYTHYKPAFLLADADRVSSTLHGMLQQD